MNLSVYEFFFFSPFLVLSKLYLPSLSNISLMILPRSSHSFPHDSIHESICGFCMYFLSLNSSTLELHAEDRNEISFFQLSWAEVIFSLSCHTSASLWLGYIIFLISRSAIFSCVNRDNICFHSSLQLPVFFSSWTLISATKISPFDWLLSYNQHHSKFFKPSYCGLSVLANCC